jgi:hypothetical protein
MEQIDESPTEFETLEDMVQFYEANKENYDLAFGTAARLYCKGTAECVAEIRDPRASRIAMDLLWGMVSSNIVGC